MNPTVSCWLAPTGSALADHSDERAAARPLARGRLVVLPLLGRTSQRYEALGELAADDAAPQRPRGRTDRGRRTEARQRASDLRTSGVAPASRPLATTPSQVGEGPRDLEAAGSCNTCSERFAGYAALVFVSVPPPDWVWV